MENKTLEIKTVPVSIKVIQVDGKRMSKAVFNQIPGASLTHVTAENMLGAIFHCADFSSTHYWILFVKNGQMRKYLLEIEHWEASKTFNNDITVKDACSIVFSMRHVTKTAINDFLDDFLINLSYPDDSTTSSDVHPLANVKLKDVLNPSDFKDVISEMEDKQSKFKYCINNQIFIAI